MILSPELRREFLVSVNVHIYSNPYWNVCYWSAFQEHRRICLCSAGRTVCTLQGWLPVIIALVFWLWNLIVFQLYLTRSSHGCFPPSYPLLPLIASVFGQEWINIQGEYLVLCTYNLINRPCGGCCTHHPPAVRECTCSKNRLAP